jgi:hypothetical protein
MLIFMLNLLLRWMSVVMLSVAMLYVVVPKVAILAKV